MNSLEMIYTYKNESRIVKVYDITYDSKGFPLLFGWSVD